MNGISVIAFSWCALNLQQFIISFYLDPTFQSVNNLLLCQTLPIHTADKHEHQQTIGAKVRLQPVIKLPKTHGLMQHRKHLPHQIEEPIKPVNEMCFSSQSS